MSEKPSFFAELKLRKVCKVLVGYTVVAWLLIQAAATVLPAQSPVPIEKEPRHRLKLENQSVRVFDVLIPPRDESLFHIHIYDGVSTRLTDAQIRIEALQGPVDEVRVKRGAIEFTRRPHPLTHRVSNIGRTPFRNVFVEILPSTRVSASAPSPAVAAGHTVVLENARVRVLRLALAPGQSSGGRNRALRGVRIAVSEGELLTESSGKKGRARKFQPGDFQWHEAGMTDSLRNVGFTAFEAVDIELK